MSRSEILIKIEGAIENPLQILRQKIKVIKKVQEKLDETEEKEAKFLEDVSIISDSVDFYSSSHELQTMAAEQLLYCELLETEISDLK